MNSLAGGNITVQFSEKLPIQRSCEFIELHSVEWDLSIILYLCKPTFYEIAVIN